MACYTPNNFYFFPQIDRFSDPKVKSKFVKYAFYGALYGGVISTLYCSPVPRVMKMTAGWATVFGLGFTRGLYNRPVAPEQSVKYSAGWRPDFRTQPNGSYVDNDWVPKQCLEKYPKA